uniref:Apolipoprotein C-III n=1 Tax=Calidris pygmaea TaxID=425635 RepID=A0A8C3J4Z0_9CHAR
GWTWSSVHHRPPLRLPLAPSPPVPTGLVLAGADTPGEPEALLRKVQEYAQKATAMAKNAFSRVQESEVAQQARRWLAENAELAKQRLGWLKEKGSIRAGGPTPDPPSTVTVLAIKQR